MTEKESKGYRGCPTGMHLAQHVHIVRYITRDWHKKHGHELTETPGDDTWKLDVGAECNLALQAAQEISERPQIGDNPAMVKAIRSLVERVAHFEELETES